MNFLFVYFRIEQTYSVVLYEVLLVVVVVENRISVSIDAVRTSKHASKLLNYMAYRERSHVTHHRSLSLRSMSLYIYLPSM